MNKVKNDSMATPLLIPYEPDEFWENIRIIIREEIVQSLKGKNDTTYQTSGLEYKPLYKINEVCNLFQVTRPAPYDWVKHGKLRP